MKKMNKKGFTLAELLIVVAIIAVLVAIAIPIFSSQLEKSKAATDAANIRACYAEAMSNSLINDGANATSDSSFKAQTDGSKFSTYDISLPSGQNGTSISMTVGQSYKVSYTTGSGWSVVAAATTPDPSPSPSSNP